MVCYRILFLFPELNCYGVAKSMLGLAQGLIARGHRVFCASQTESDTVEKWTVKGVKYVPMPLRAMKRSPAAALSAGVLLTRMVRRERIDLVHSHHRWTSFLVSLFKPCIQRPIVTTCHGILQGRRGLSFWGERVICVSDDTRRNMIEHFGVRPEKTVVIHNGIDCLAWQGLRRNDARPGENGASGSPCLTNIAKLSAEKDQATLLKAMPSILARFPRARLKLVGAGKLEAELKRLARKLGLASAVDFVGEVSDVRPVLAQTDVFVLCSTTEGLPMSILEAMAAGVPVVATAVGGVPKLVRHRETGCLVRAGDARRLADEICFLLSNPEQAENLQRKGQEWVAREFSIERMASHTELVYRDVLAEWGAR